MAKKIVNGPRLESEQKSHGQFALVMIRLKNSPAAIVGLGIFIIMVLLAIFAPVIAPYGYNDMDYLHMTEGASAAHWLGTDALGRDTLSRLLYGARYSLTIGVVATLAGSLIGIMVGAIAGFFGGVADDIIMRLCDVLQSIPGMILNMAMACALGAGFVNCIIALSVGQIAGSARIIRSSIIKIRGLEYIDAASVINCKKSKVIMKHILPNAISPSIVQMTMGVGAKITAAAGMSYLGLGVQNPTPEWGAMLSDGRSYMTTAPLMCIVPGIAIMIAVLSLNLFGDGLRDAMDPKLKK